MKITQPKSETMVIIYGVAQHHTRYEWSIVASRDRQGGWTVERNGEESASLLAIPSRPMEASKTVLSPDKAKALERLLGDPALYGEEATGSAPQVGGVDAQMEIVTPKRTRRATWMGRLTGKLGEVADLVLGAG